jgi:hypothetical protein
VNSQSQKPLYGASLLLLALASTLASVSAGAGDIYQWVDSSGAVHISDEVPPQYKDRAKVVGSSQTDAVDAKDQAAARQRAADEAERLKRIKGDPLSRADKPSQSPSKAPAAGLSGCAAKWAAYQASQACFAPYRTQNGIRGDSGCTQVTDPTAECGSVPPNAN